jgi:hypothetical protein
MSIFDCELKYDSLKDNDITDPKTTQFEENFAFDTTWKYRIEPFDPAQPQPVKLTIGDNWPYSLHRTLNEKENQIIYDIPIPSNHYTICRIDSSVYPKKQCPNNFSIHVRPM